MLLFLYEFYYIGICLGGFLFGLYSGIFALYLQCLHASKTDAVNAKNILFYALCFLYILSVATIGFDIVSYVVDSDIGNLNLVYAITTTQFTLFAFCDFIAQSILIYRCWIVWGQNIRVVIVPSILAFAFLATCSGLVFQIDFNQSSRVHKCECSCDGFNRIQDLHGVPTSPSQTYYYL